VFNLFVALSYDELSLDRIVPIGIRVSKRNVHVRGDDVSKTPASRAPGNGAAHLHVSSRKMGMLSNLGKVK
jgi:hypothetical protein